MAKDAISKIEKVERGCDELIETEKEKLKLRLKEVKKKANDVLENERKKNLNLYNKVVEEFKVCVEKRSEEFSKKVDDHCSQFEDDLNKNVKKAVDFVVAEILKS